MSDLIFTKLQDTRAVLAGFQGESSLRAVLLSQQKQRFCPFETGMTTKLNIEFDILVDLPEMLSRSTKYDICILCCHKMAEEGILLGLRQREVAKLYSVWLWD